MPTKTRTLTPEQSLRKWLRENMLGILSMTWLESGVTAAGVPDLAYVVKSGNYETGWLELKAEDHVEGAKTVTFKVRPTQHEWIGNHHHRVPVHFLLGYGDHVYLLDGKHHRLLAAKIALDYLAHLSTAHCDKSELRVMLAHQLANLTDRYLSRG